MRRLRADVWLLELGWAAPLGSNAYLIDDGIDPETGERSERMDSGTSDNERGGGGDEGEVTLIDTGLRYSRRSLREELAAAGYEPADIDRVLLTHYDLDHTGGLDTISVDCPVYLGERDIALLEGERPLPLAHHKGLFHRFARRFFPLPADIDLRSVSDGERIGRFTAYHTPGHNPGHMVYIHDAGAAFLGDLVWENDGELTTPFWGDSYDMRRLRESVKKLARDSSSFDLICTGHGAPFTEDGHDKLQELADQL
ncbi:MBL fold metallo-hydrolase [Halocatena marina]|nr:MBL fold metallo-hydrolase [Halocatena marina]